MQQWAGLLFFLYIYFFIIYNFVVLGCLLYNSELNCGLLASPSQPSNICRLLASQSASYLLVMFIKSDSEERRTAFTHSVIIFNSFIHYALPFDRLHNQKAHSSHSIILIKVDALYIIY